MRSAVLGFAVSVAVVAAGLPTVASVTTFDDRNTFLAAAGSLHLEDFELYPLVGESGGGGVALLPFHGFRVWSDIEALKVQDVAAGGNHSVSIFGPQYLTADTDSLGLTATLTLEFEPPVFALGFWIIDLDSFDMGATVNGVTYVIPATGNAGNAYFGILSAAPISELTLDSLGSDNHYSLDDVSFDFPPAVIEAGSVPDGSMPGAPLTVYREPDGDLTLSWGSSCGLSDEDFEIYEGALGTFPERFPVACTTGGLTSAVVTPAPGPTYYLVVPRTVNREGSHGVDGGGGQRPVPVSTCLLQQTGGCL